MSERLRPCPFCGEVMKLQSFGSTEDVYVQCQTCSTTGPNGVDLECAVLQWNKRDAIESELAALREENGKLKSDLETKQRLISDICSDWNEKCNETCSSWGHDEDCRATNIGAAKRHLQSQLATARKALIECRGILNCHEDAIREDSGNTNFQVTMDKIQSALKALSEGDKT